MMNTALPSYRPKLSFLPTPNAKQSTAKTGSTTTTTASTRPFYIRGNVTSQAAGSATCELGRTKVVCSVHGPRARRQAGRAEFSGRGAIDVEASFAPFSRQQQQTKDAIEKANRDLSSFLENCLESSVQLFKFPKSVLDVYVVVLEDDGSSFACAALCASFALAKAGVEMFDLVTCCTLYLSRAIGEIGVDPDLEQESNAQALCTIGFLSTSGEVTCLDVTPGSTIRNEEAGDYDIQTVNSFVNLGQTVCTELASVMRAQLREEATTIQE